MRTVLFPLWQPAPLSNQVLEEAMRTVLFPL
jgi:hypothetical protein